MNSKVSVTRVVIDAAKFVLAHWGDCIFRALPILFLISIVSYLHYLLGGVFQYAGKFVEPFLYAMFAVSWHRFSVLKAERIRTGLPYQFGKREIKFGALSVVSTLGFVTLQQTLGALLPPMAAMITFLLMLVPILLTLVFIYPAIALDQPVRIAHFLSSGMKQLVSFIAAFIVVGAAIFAASWALVLLLPVIASIISPDLTKLLVFVVKQLVLTPIALALMASTASFLYRDVIGLQEIVPEGDAGAEADKNTNNAPSPDPDGK